MEATIKAIIEKKYHCETEKIVPMGGGFYGRAFLVEMPCEPFQIVLKLYLFPGISQKEYIQLKTLSKSAHLKMPKLYWVETASESIGYDVLAMEYLTGVNAGNIVLDSMSDAAKSVIAEEIVDNLLAYHRTINPEGFGPLDAAEYFDDWRSYYYPMASGIFQKAKKLYENGKLSAEIFHIMETALEHYDKIFYLPIQKASLIHGDYNTWNVMLDEKLEHAVAVIDPFNCCWADNEFDLYQLDNANGKDFGLLARYRQKHELSENFQIKREFYELFTELNHFYDANIDLQYSNIPQQAAALYCTMKEQGIV